MKRCASSLRSLTAVIALGICACTPETATPDDSGVVIEVLPGATRCSVRGIELNCSDVAAHLRDKLGLKPGHFVKVRFIDLNEAPLSYEKTRTLFDSLESAGFTMGKGYIVD